MCAIGTNADAKRTGLVTVVFNCLGIPWLLLVVTVAHRVGLLDSLWNYRDDQRHHCQHAYAVQSDARRCHCCRSPD